MPPQKKGPHNEERLALQEGPTRQEMSEAEIAIKSKASEITSNEPPNRVSSGRVELTVEEIHEMNKTYTVAEIAEKTGVTRQAVWSRLKRAGYDIIPHPERHRVGANLPPVEKLLELHKKHNLETIGEMFDCTAPVIHHALKGHPDYDNTRHHGKGGQKPKLPPAKQLIEIMKTEGLNGVQVAKRFGATSSAVYNRVNKWKRKQAQLKEKGDAQS